MPTPRLIARLEQIRWLVFALALLSALPCHAGKLLEARADLQKGHYLLHLVMQIHGKYADVYRVLVDFNHLSRVNNSIKYSKELSHKGKQYVVSMVSRGCVWFFCRNVKQVDIVTELDNGYLESEVDPKRSDFRYGEVLWQIIDEGKSTLIKYNADFVPNFWIPPLVGSDIFEHQLLKQGKKTIDGIERLVRKPND